MQYISILNSPVGKVYIHADNEYICAVHFNTPSESNHFEENELTKSASCQLNEYFEGKRKAFDLPLKQEGTSFQQQVWKEVSAVHFGRTLTYFQIAKNLNNTGAVRAVGAANGQNNILILIPCHRIIGTDGTLTGYAGEMWRKEWLLQHEAKFSGKGFQTKLL